MTDEQSCNCLFHKMAPFPVIFLLFIQHNAAVLLADLCADPPLKAILDGYEHICALALSVQPAVLSTSSNPALPLSCYNAGEKKMSPGHKMFIRLLSVNVPCLLAACCNHHELCRPSTRYSLHTGTSQTSSCRYVSP